MTEQRHSQNYLIPSLISVIIGLAAWMALNLNRISETLAVVVYRSDNHERRLNNLEEHPNVWRK